MAEYCIEVEDLWKAYVTRQGDNPLRHTRVVALKGVSFALKGGEVLALVGPNGAGKTTVMEIIVGVIKHYKGRVRVFGMDPKVEWARVRDRIGYMPEAIALYRKTTPMRFLRYMLNFHTSSHGIEDPVSRVKEVAEIVGISEHLHTPIATLSLGNMRKVMLAQALLHKPDILVLDEPTSGLDPMAQVEFRATLRRMRYEGCGILISSHILHEVQRLADSVCIINRGRIMHYGPLSEIKKSVLKGTTKVFIEAKGMDLRLVEKGVNKALGRGARFNVHDGGDGVGAEIRFDTHLHDKDLSILLKGLIDSGLRITRYEPKRPDLEDIYIETISGGERNERE